MFNTNVSNYESTTTQNYKKINNFFTEQELNAIEGIQEYITNDHKEINDQDELNNSRINILINFIDDTKNKISKDVIDTILKEVIEKKQQSNYPLIIITELLCSTKSEKGLELETFKEIINKIDKHNINENNNNLKIKIFHLFLLRNLENVSDEIFDEINLETQNILNISVDFKDDYIREQYLKMQILLLTKKSQKATTEEFDKLLDSENYQNSKDNLLVCNSINNFILLYNNKFSESITVAFERQFQKFIDNFDQNSSELKDYNALKNIFASQLNLAVKAENWFDQSIFIHIIEDAKKN